MQIPRENCELRFGILFSASEDKMKNIKLREMGSEIKSKVDRGRCVSKTYRCAWTNGQGERERARLID